MVERLIDKLAGTLKLDPADVRLKNMIPRFENGHAVITGLTYDSGDYPAGLKKVLDHVKYKELRKEQENARKNGRCVGIGLSRMELCALAFAGRGAIGFQGSLGKRDRRVHRRQVNRSSRIAHGQADDHVCATGRE